MKTLKYTIMMLLLTVALQAAGQSYVIDKVCLGTERHYRIDGETGSTYLWQLTDGAGNPVILSNPSGIKFTGTDPITGQPKEGSEVIIQWSQPGTFRLAAIQYSSLGCDTLEQGDVQVFEQPTASAGSALSICGGAVVTLSEASSDNYSALKWTSSGDGLFNDPVILNPIYTPGPKDLMTSSVTLTLTAQGMGNGSSCAPAVDAVTLTISSIIAPTFSEIGSLCQNSTAPALPLHSNNSPAITGTWSPATINTTNAVTTTYTFTPDAGQCATVTSMDILIKPSVIPTFVPVGPLCQNSTPPALPASSVNGVTGTWSPTIITTSIAGTTTYTFTSATGQCASSATINVRVTPQTIPNFYQIEPLCENSIAPALPANSAENIFGIWNPELINTSSAGITTYLFTPLGGQCSKGGSMDIVITPQIKPVFAPIGSLCQNSTPPSLPAAALNFITGTWNPAIISTAATGTSTYAFTPDADQCATTFTCDITINPRVIPVFTPIDPICQDDTAPLLPSASENGIAGTWNPAAINTTTPGTTTYTFTPDSGECATTFKIEVTIIARAIPVLAPIGPLCLNTIASPLPSNSTNGISGTWNPSWISAVSEGITTYTFTPKAGQCATKSTLAIQVNSIITPTFNAIPVICSGSVPPALPKISTNGISGTWNPATVSNIATTAYIFTPDAGQCATIAVLTISVNPKIAPLFNAVPTICAGSTAPVLSKSSLNGIDGSWNPSMVSNVKTATYTFTPDAGTCASSASLTVTVDPLITPVFNVGTVICAGSSAPILAPISDNAILGSWLPSDVSNISTDTYTFTPDNRQCAAPIALKITVKPFVTPTFAAIPEICSGVAAPILPQTSDNKIAGIWNPITINTLVSGTSTYTFKPDAGQCSTDAALDVTINPRTTPIFAPIGPLTWNSVAPTLPATSANGISGSWNPATINTANVGTTTFIFTPAAGQCATTAKMDIKVEILVVLSMEESIIGSCEQVKLDASKSVGDIVKYDWSVLDKGGVLTRQTGLSTEFYLASDYTGSLPADFRVRLLVTDRTGHVKSDTLSIMVDLPPVADILSSGDLEKDGSMVVDGSISKGSAITYRWSTSQGKIVGPGNGPTAKLLGAGIYSLEVIDRYGCKSVKNFKFPFEMYQLIAVPDYARISWSQDTTLNVIQNDRSSVNLIPGSVRVIAPPLRGEAKVNANGTITYTPKLRHTGRDQFVYEVCNVVNLCDSALVTIDIYSSGVTAMEGFSPNGDGINDYLIFKGLENYPKSQLYVYTRSGQLVYQSEDYQNNWDGKAIQSTLTNGEKVPTGIYYYVLKLGGTTQTVKASVYIGY